MFRVELKGVDEENVENVKDLERDPNKMKRNNHNGFLH